MNRAIWARVTFCDGQYCPAAQPSVTPRLASHSLALQKISAGCTSENPLQVPPNWMPSMPKVRFAPPDGSRKIESNPPGTTAVASDQALTLVSTTFPLDTGTPDLNQVTAMVTGPEEVLARESGIAKNVACRASVIVIW